MGAEGQKRFLDVVQGPPPHRCTVLIYKNDGATTQNSQKNPDTLGT